MPTNRQYLDSLSTRMGYADPEDKKKWHNAAKTMLRRLAKELDNDYGGHDPIRSNQGGIAVSGEVTLHCDRLYVQVSQSCMGMGYDVLFRSCEHRKDYTGGQNNFASVEELVNTDQLAARIKRTVRVS